MITVDQVMSWNPCEKYTRSRVTELFAGRKSLTLPELLALDIPAVDRMWVLTRPEALTREQTNAWMERVASRAVTTRALRCGVPEVEAWAARWLSGEDRSQEDRSQEASAARAASAWAWAEWAWASERDLQITDALAVLEGA